MPLNMGISEQPAFASFLGLPVIFLTNSGNCLQIEKAVFRAVGL
jgi:hypothetical protein